VIPPTGNAFDVEFGQSIKGEDDRLVEISGFWGAALQATRLGSLGAHQVVGFPGV